MSRQRIYPDYNAKKSAPTRSENISGGGPWASASAARRRPRTKSTARPARKNGRLSYQRAKAA